MSKLSGRATCLLKVGLDEAKPLLHDALDVATAVSDITQYYSVSEDIKTQ
jgi:hypothetical protein